MDKNTLINQIINQINTGEHVDNFMTTAEIAKRLNVTTRTVGRWIEDGLFEGATKINPNIRNSPFIVPKTSVDAFEETRRQEQTGE